MASSLIRINEATSDELCGLRHIGPRRAERIIRYREEVTPITNSDELAEAAGITRDRARSLVNDIDWTRSRPRQGLTILFLIAGFTLCAAYLIVDIAQTGLDVADPRSTLYNTALIMVVLGCIFAIVGLVIGDRGTTKIMSVATVAAGSTLLVSLLIALLMMSADDPFSQHVIQIWKFAVFVVVIISLQFGPGFMLRNFSGSLDRIAILFDYGQLPLAALLLAGIQLGSAPGLVAEIFSIWAGIVFANNGYELIRGGSSFVAALSDTDRARLHFLVTEDHVPSPSIQRGARPGYAGGLLLAFGAALAISGVVSMTLG